MSILPAKLHCPKCRHDLTGLPPADRSDAGPETVLVCPECGSSTTIYAAADELIPHRGWSYSLLWLAAMAVFLLFAGCVLSTVVYLVWSAATGGP